MQIFRDLFRYCDVGIPTKQKDINGKLLYSGDIIELLHGIYIGTELEEWNLFSDNLTVIVGRQYQNNKDGSIKKITNKPKLFTMGIEECGIQNKEWKVVLCKSHKNISEGENVPYFNFTYKTKI